ncbi:MAG: winged helix-turn-helix domain-containing tetratricopeptide repeat protein [Terriglobia bacterium]
MSLYIRELYRFDDFELDPSRRTFLRNGTPVLVSPKAFDVLTCLVANPGRVVTKDELLKAVWPDSFVEESNLAQHISWLRKALADRSKYIVTVPGRGYQFTATVQTEPDPPPAKQHGEIRLQRTRERTHVVIEELAPASGPASEAVSASFRPAISDSAPTQLATPKPGIWKTVASVGALILVAIVAGSFGYKKFGNGLLGRTVSIAVLPFTNLTGDPAKEYLSDGVTEEMINGLARAEGTQLRVIARTSSMSYKDTRKDVQDIARELGVQYVLEGCVQSEGNHIHITAQLIRGGDQTYLWADSFDGTSGQILEFENRLAGSVAHSLSLTLLAGKGPEHAPVNSAAHDAYLQGLHSLSQRSRPGFADALRSFGTAVAQDPQYARAYAELAVTYNLLGQYNWMDTPAAESQAQAAAQQAIAADPSLAEAHAALGFNQWFYQWNPAAAEKELLRAIQLEPTNVDARHWYALVLMTGGRFGDAEKQMRLALALDPKAPILRTNLGWLHYSRRQYPLAIEEMQSVVKDHPDFVTAHYKLWWAYSQTGDVPSAWNEVKALAHLIFTPEDEKGIVAVYEKHGYAGVLEALTDPGNRFYTQGLVDDARCMTFAGDKAAALQFLDRALRRREGWMIFVESDPAFDSLRSDPQYARLIREVHAAAESSH